MKRRIIIVIVVLVAIVVMGALISAGVYFTKTYDAEAKEEYCMEHSEIGASEFSAYGVTKLNGYMFWVSDSKEEPYQQELFIFRKELLWGCIDMQRYVFVKQVTGTDNQVVSTVQLEAKSEFANRETTAILFFSSNPSEITKYRISFQENGRFVELHGGVTQLRSFVIGFLELGSGEYLHRVYEGAIFYDENGNIIEEEGNVQYLK